MKHIEKSKQYWIDLEENTHYPPIACLIQNIVRFYGTDVGEKEYNEFKAITNHMKFTIVKYIFSCGHTVDISNAKIYTVMGTVEKLGFKSGDGSIELFLVTDAEHVLDEKEYINLAKLLKIFFTLQ